MWFCCCLLLATYLIFLFTEHFNRALQLMNQAVTGTMQPGARENVAYLTTTERRYLFWFWLNG